MKYKHILLIGITILLLVVGTVVFFPAGNQPAEVLTENTEGQQIQPSPQPEEILPSPEQNESSSNDVAVQVEKENTPKPVEEVQEVPQQPTEEPVVEEKGDDGLKCTLSVRCNDVLEHIDTLASGKETVIPPNGVIYPTQEVLFEPGESVFDVLLREMQRNGVHIEFVENPMFQSAYIRGIGNLYEFDCGDCSGWLYAVNGVQPKVGCSQYILQNGDRIEFFYSCNWMNEPK